jgi:tetratricopeptide (TPR) repeat protein
MGLIRQALGQVSEAEATFRTIRDDVARALLGDLLRDQGRLAEAEATYRGIRGDWARSRLGDLLRDQGRLAEAEATYRAILDGKGKPVVVPPARPIDRRTPTRARADLNNQPSPTNARPSPTDRRKQAGTRTKLASVLKELGRWQDAESEYRRVLAERERLAAEHPSFTDDALELGECYRNLAEFFSDSGNPQASLAWFDRALRTLEPTSTPSPDSARAREYLRNALSGKAQALARLKQFADADAAWERAVSLTDPADRLPLLVAHLLVLTRVGAHERAVAEVDALVVAPCATADTFYDAARIYAVTTTAARADVLDPDRLTARSIELLRQAFAKGYTNVAHMLQDRDLAPLRHRADYAALLWDLADTPAPPPADRR